MVVDINKQSAATWVDTYSAAFRAGDGAQTSAMLSDMSHWSRENLADLCANYTDASEGLDVIVDGLHRLNVAVPVGVTTARDAFKLIATKNMAITAERPSLSRRARLIRSTKTF